jgi:hypothetical protein
MRNEDFELETTSDIEIKSFLGNVLITLKHDKSSGKPLGAWEPAKSLTRNG